MPNLQKENSSHFETKIVSHYVDFNPSQPPPWSYFDISTCVHERRMFLKLTIDGKNWCKTLLKK